MSLPGEWEAQLHSEVPLLRDASVRPFGMYFLTLIFAPPPWETGVGAAEEGSDEKWGIQEMIQDGREQGRLKDAWWDWRRSHYLDRSHASASSGPGSRTSPFCLSLFHLGHRESRMLHTQNFIFNISPKYERNGCFPWAFRIPQDATWRDPGMVVIAYNPKTWKKARLGCLRPCLPKP